MCVRRETSVAVNQSAAQRRLGSTVLPHRAPWPQKDTTTGVDGLWERALWRGGTGGVTPDTTTVLMGDLLRHPAVPQLRKMAGKAAAQSLRRALPTASRCALL